MVASVLPESADAIGQIIFNVFRCAIAIGGGWFLVVKAGASLRRATLAGVLVLTVDHIFLKGGWFLVEEIFHPSSDHIGLLGFGGVLISFVLFLPVAALLGWFGGWVGRRTNALAHNP